MVVSVAHGGPLREKQWLGFGARICQGGIEDKHVLDCIDDM